MEPISHETLYREEIDALNEQCFPGWQRKRQPNSEEFVGSEEMPNLNFEEIEHKLNDFQKAMMTETDGEETDNYNKEESEGKTKSTLDGLMEKAMNTVELVVRKQREEERKTLATEADGTTNAMEWNCQVLSKRRDCSECDWIALSFVKRHLSPEPTCCAMSPKIISTCHFINVRSAKITGHIALTKVSENMF